MKPKSKVIDTKMDKSMVISYLNECSQKIKVIFKLESKSEKNNTDPFMAALTEIKESLTTIMSSLIRNVNVIKTVENAEILDYLIFAIEEFPNMTLDQTNVIGSISVKSFLIFDRDPEALKLILMLISKFHVNILEHAHALIGTEIHTTKRRIMEMRITELVLIVIQSGIRFNYMCTTDGNIRNEGGINLYKDVIGNSAPHAIKWVQGIIDKCMPLNERKVYGPYLQQMIQDLTHHFMIDINFPAAMDLLIITFTALLNKLNDKDKKPSTPIMTLIMKACGKVAECLYEFNCQASKAPKDLRRVSKNVGENLKIKVDHVLNVVEKGSNMKEVMEMVFLLLESGRKFNVDTYSYMTNSWNYLIASSYKHYYDIHGSSNARNPEKSHKTVVPYLMKMVKYGKSRVVNDKVVEPIYRIFVSQFLTKKDYYKFIVKRLIVGSRCNPCAGMRALIGICDKNPSYLNREGLHFPMLYKEFIKSNSVLARRNVINLMKLHISHNRKEAVIKFKEYEESLSSELYIEKNLMVRFLEFLEKEGIHRERMTMILRPMIELLDIDKFEESASDVISAISELWFQWVLEATVINEDKIMVYTIYQMENVMKQEMGCFKKFLIALNVSKHGSQFRNMLSYLLDEIIKKQELSSKLNITHFELLYEVSTIQPKLIEHNLDNFLRLLQFINHEKNWDLMTILLKLIHELPLKHKSVNLLNLMSEERIMMFMKIEKWSKYFVPILISSVSNKTSYDLYYTAFLKPPSSVTYETILIERILELTVKHKSNPQDFTTWDKTSVIKCLVFLGNSICHLDSKKKAESFDEMYNIFAMSLDYWLDRWANNPPTIVVETVGTVCCKFIEISQKPIIKKTYTRVLDENSQDSISNKIQIIENLSMYIEELEQRKSRDNTTKGARLLMNDDQTTWDELQHKLKKKYLWKISELYMTDHKLVRNSASNFIFRMLRHGLIHPDRIIPNLVCMSTDDRDIAKLACEALTSCSKLITFTHLMSGIEKSVKFYKVRHSTQQSNIISILTCPDWVLFDCLYNVFEDKLTFHQVMMHFLKQDVTNENLITIFIVSKTLAHIDYSGKRYVKEDIKELIKLIIYKSEEIMSPIYGKDVTESNEQDTVPTNIYRMMTCYKDLWLNEASVHYLLYDLKTHLMKKYNIDESDLKSDDERTKEGKKRSAFSYSPIQFEPEKCLKFWEEKDKLDNATAFAKKINAMREEFKKF